MLSTFRFSRKHFIGAAFIALALALPQPSAMAAGELDTLDTLDKGPAVGTPIPHPLTAPDQNNKIRDFESLTGKNGLIVLFSRSFEWWTPCIIQAVAWNDRVDEFRALGYEFVGLTFDDVPALKRFTRIRKIKYDVLADPKSEIIRAFDLINESYPQGSYGYNIAHPMIVVIGPDGKVKQRFSDPNHSSPPSIDAILAAMTN